MNWCIDADADADVTGVQGEGDDAAADTDSMPGIAEAARRRRRVARVLVCACAALRMLTDADRRRSELAKGHLSLVLPERSPSWQNGVRERGVSSRRAQEPSAAACTGAAAVRRAEIAGSNTLRQRLTQERYEREVAHDMPPHAAPPRVSVRSDDIRPGRRPPVVRETVPRDKLLEQAVPVAPVYAQLVALCLAEDVPRGRFVAAYCRLLERTTRAWGRVVSEDELAALADAEPFGFSARTAYRHLRWGYNLFATWSYKQYRRGHIFTPEELAPMAAWVQSMNKAAAVADVDNPP